MRNDSNRGRPRAACLRTCPAILHNGHNAPVQGMKKPFPTDVTDKEWTLLKPFSLPSGALRKAGRLETPASARACYNAIRYLLKTGCHGECCPRSFPRKSTVHDAFTRWTARGLWPRLNHVLRPSLRLALKKTPFQRCHHRQSK